MLILSPQTQAHVAGVSLIVVELANVLWFAVNEHACLPCVILNDE